MSELLNTSDSDEDLPKKKRVKIEDFVNTINKYSNEEFTSHFRLKKMTVNSLIDNYSNTMKRPNRGGVEEITAEKRIYVTLWYLANTNTFREISNLFDISFSSAHRCVVRVTHWLIRSAHLHIKWPKLEEEQENISSMFQQVREFPHVLGCIDGSHIQINKPARNSNDYYNRKKYYSILLQGVVGPNQKFYDVHVGEPGSIHDSRMFKKTELYKRCTDHHESLFKERRVLLGDSAYPCLTWLIPPYRDLGNLSDSQKQFNIKHSATRVVVEHAFGLLKNRFRRLRKFDNITIDFAVNCTIAACVLHNICIDNNDVIVTEEGQDTRPTIDTEFEESLIIEQNDYRRHELLEEIFSDII